MILLRRIFDISSLAHQDVSSDYLRCVHPDYIGTWSKLLNHVLLKPDDAHTALRERSVSVSVEGLRLSGSEVGHMFCTIPEA